MKNENFIWLLLAIILTGCSNDDNSAAPEINLDTNYLISEFTREAAYTLQFEYNSENQRTAVVEPNTGTPWYNYKYANDGQLAEIQEYQNFAKHGCQNPTYPSYNIYKVINRTNTTMELSSTSYDADGTIICSDPNYKITFEGNLIKSFEFRDYMLVFEHNAAGNLITSYITNANDPGVNRGDEKLFVDWDENVRPDHVNIFSEVWVYPIFWFPNLHTSQSNPISFMYGNDPSNTIQDSMYEYDQNGNTVKQITSDHTFSKKYIPAN